MQTSYLIQNSVKNTNFSLSYEIKTLKIIFLC